MQYRIQFLDGSANVIRELTAGARNPGGAIYVRNRFVVIAFANWNHDGALVLEAALQGPRQGRN
jgi:hypothetical protein